MVHALIDRVIPLGIGDGIVFTDDPLRVVPSGRVRVLGGGNRPVFLPRGARERGVRRERVRRLVVDIVVDVPGDAQVLGDVDALSLDRIDGVRRLVEFRVVVAVRVLVRVRLLLGRDLRVVDVRFHEYAFEHVAPILAIEPLVDDIDCVLELVDDPLERDALHHLVDELGVVINRRVLRLVGGDVDLV